MYNDNETFVETSQYEPIGGTMAHSFQEVCDDPLLRETTSSKLIKLARATDWDMDIATCKQFANTAYNQEIEGLGLKDELTRTSEQYPKDLPGSFQSSMNANSLYMTLKPLDRIWSLMIRS